MDEPKIGVDLEQAEDSAATIKQLIENMLDKLHELSNIMERNIGEGAGEEPILNVPWANELKASWYQYKNSKIEELLTEMKNRAGNIVTTAENTNTYVQQI